MNAGPPLRVAFFAGSYEHILDGVVLTSNRQVAYLVNRNVPVRVYAPTNGKPLVKPAGDFQPVPSVGFPGNPYRLALGLRGKVRRDLERFNPNLVHLATPDWLGADALRWAKRKRVPVVATFHTRFASYLKHYHAGFLEPVCWRMLRWFYRQCDSVFVSCESTARDLRQNGVQANYALVPAGVDTSSFSPTKRSSEWRQRHGFRNGDIVIAFVGRLVWEKGLAPFAAAIRQLESQNVPHRVLIVGDGPARDAFRKLLPHAAFTGQLSGEELTTAYASSDLFFFPSASETFGCVTVEALASGLPCVVADAPGSRDIVRHNVDGIICPVDDAREFTAALMRLIQNPLLRARLAANGVLRADLFRWDSVLSLLMNQLQRVAKSVLS